MLRDLETAAAMAGVELDEDAAAAVITGMIETGELSHGRLLESFRNWAGASVDDARGWSRSDFQVNRGCRESQ